MTGLSSSDSRTKTTWARLWTPKCILAFTIAITYVAFPPMAGWNENSRFNLTRAIVDHRTFTIDAYRLNTGDKAQCGAHTCTDKAPGTSLVAVVPYALYRTYLKWTGAPAPRARIVFADKERARRNEMNRWDRVQVNRSFITALFVAGLFVSVLPGVLAVLTMVSLCRLIGVGERYALTMGAIYGLGTIAFPYSTAFFGHQLAAALLLGAFFLVERECRGLSPGRQSSALIKAGLLGGYAVVTEYPLAVPLAALALYVLLRRCGRASIWFAVGAVAPLGGLAAYLWSAFGTPFALGYGHLTHARFARGQSQGLFGVTYPRFEALFGTLLGRFRGLLYVSPVLALAPLGWLRLWRRPDLRPLLVMCAFVTLYFVLLNSSYYMWWGGASAGPRHIVPGLPFLCLPLVGLLSLNKRWHPLAWALAAISMANMLALTAVGPAAPEYGDILFDYAWPTLLGYARHPVRISLTSNVFGLPPAANLLLLPGLWGTAAALIWRNTRPDDSAEAV